MTAQNHHHDSISPGLQNQGGLVQVRTEVTELMEMARNEPDRDIAKLMKEAQAIGEIMALTGKTKSGGCDAYYRFRMGDGTIEGPTVGLMEALEKVWRMTLTVITIAEERGNRITFDCKFVDLKTGNFKTRPAMFTLSDPPGKFAKDPEQADRWRNMQLQSATSKATRNILEHGLPQWLWKAATTAAQNTKADEVLKDSKGNVRPLIECVNEAIKAWEAMKITAPDLEAYLRLPVSSWAPSHLVELLDLWDSISEKRTTIEEIFGPLRADATTEPPAATGAASSPPQRALPPPSKSALEQLGLEPSLKDILERADLELASVTDSPGVDEIVKGLKKTAPKELIPNIEALRKKHHDRLRQ